MKQYIKPETTKVELSEDIAAEICNKADLLKASNANVKYTFKNYYKHGYHFGCLHTNQNYCLNVSKTIEFNGGDDVKIIDRSTHLLDETGWRSGCRGFVGDVTVTKK